MAAAAGAGGWGGGGGGWDSSWKGNWDSSWDNSGKDPNKNGQNEIDVNWYQDCRWCKKCNQKTYLTILSIP